MYSYHFKAVKNYKDAFQIMRVAKIERFDSRSYFYCINNGIDPLTVAVDPSRVPPVVTEGQSYTELPKELWDRTEQMERRERARLSKSRLSNVAYTVQLGGQEQSCLTRIESPRLPS